MLEHAQASGHAEESGSNVASRRKAADCQRVFHDTPTSGNPTRVNESVPMDIGAQGPLQDGVAA